jgi:DNA-binding response OmpR family regulator
MLFPDCKNSGNAWLAPKPFPASKQASQLRLFMLQNGQRILVVDDEPIIADSLVRILNLKGFQAVAAYSGETAVTIATTFMADIAIIDVMLGDVNGIETASMIVRDLPSCNIVLFSGHPETASLVESQKPSFEVLAKPLSPEYLLERLTALHAPETPPEN